MSTSTNDKQAAPPVINGEAPQAAAAPSQQTGSAAGQPAAAGAAADQDASQQPSKKGLKKAAKAAELAAKKAAKAALGDDKATVTSAKKDKAKPAKEAASPSAAAPAKDDWKDPTVPGQKKDLSAPMEASYNPIHVESSWYEWWEAAHFYAPRPVTESDPHDPAKTFVVPIPPPNVTGSLHIGHALTISIQDTLCRWYRMQGYRVLYNPGYDHAGIATQAVVEKRLAKLENLTRHDLGREKFLQRVFAWKDDYAARIGKQLRRLGASYDWSREAFTMDEQRSKAVVEAFCRLYADGVIYRANRLVNWCCKLTTTLSNLEVEQRQLDGRTLLSVPGYDAKERIEFGVIVSFAYHIEGSDEKIIVATTRPETMLGDTAVAVHPDDTRYKHLHGKMLVHPFIPGRRVPIVTDAIAVDMEFGTGAVKITPAHDPNDYEVGKRHNLEFINILNDDGTLNENAGPFKGIKRLSARRAVIEALKERGDYVETKDNPMTVPICSRSGDVIEPVMKPQWWVNSGKLAQEALAAIKEQGIKIEPVQSEREFYHWMENIQDWCISRQLWWGHRVPAYFVNVFDRPAAGAAGTEESDPREDLSNWVIARTEEEAHEQAKKVANGAAYRLEQDEDVLDTWFSSGLWPFSILNWPNPPDAEDFNRFYPNSLLETGWDILFFWVARMIMLGVHLTGKVPFKEVFCHAMVRDAHGRKMSKSLGNVIDPIDVIQGIQLEALHEQLRQGNLDDKEVQKAIQGQKKDFPKGIPQCGTDALRLALCAYTSAGRDINLDILRVEGYRKFCNKLWNATRFALLKLQDGFQPTSYGAPLTGNESLVERWILHKLDTAVKEVNANLAARNFMNAVTAAYSFWLYELCDVFIEAIKPVTDPASKDYSDKACSSAQHTLYTCLDEGLKLLHPFMPYVTEELWHRLPRRPDETQQTISLTAYPAPNKQERENDEAERQFEQVFAAVKTVRGLATQYGVTSDIQVFLEAKDDATATLVGGQDSVISTLVKGCRSVRVVRSAADVPAGCAVSQVTTTLNAHLLVRGLVNIDQELAKLDKKLDIVQAQLSKNEAQRTQADWGRRPENVRKQVEDAYKTLEAERDAIVSAKKNFESIKG
ncbi:putative VAS1-valyl-tRNA synthetase [Tilletiaria anomala UBC 951]|uniref:Valine--tRNA ligase, mitochondrial n=1 Tax=Tilletiaria anomala (strain ATCC 24038 / CBS 436.72 / UBC 951) TaxID=1037660 RepID=A0A066VTW9_TILAU|nr:putative VAS1-valyl-tRNA synthetase [Tilletiaria anomala UBC 951]KDN44896.1 putative VAS1-valyl-tRNA synthetase [Tilletiaria anomala UBC 951]